MSEHLGADAPARIEAMLTMQAMHPHDPPSFYLFSAAVDPEAQGRGLGAALLAKCSTSATASGFPRTWNRAARATSRSTSATASSRSAPTPSRTAPSPPRCGENHEPRVAE